MRIMTDIEKFDLIISKLDKLESGMTDMREEMLDMKPVSGS